jgi:hypothetical protein
MQSVANIGNRETARVTWTCEVCGQPIADGEGYVAMSYAELHEYKPALKAWEERIAEAYPGPWRAYPFSELHDHPSPVRWHVLHGRCDPRPEGDDYWIGTERIRTAADVISWSAHLLEKNWIQDTTWSDVLREVEGQLGGSLA